MHSRWEGAEPFVERFFLGMPRLAGRVGSPLVGRWVTIGGPVDTIIGLLGSVGAWLCRQLGSIQRRLLESWLPLLLEEWTLVWWAANV